MILTSFILPAKVAAINKISSPIRAPIWVRIVLLSGETSLSMRIFTKFPSGSGQRTSPTAPGSSWTCIVQRSCPMAAISSSDPSIQEWTRTLFQFLERSTFQSTLNTNFSLENMSRQFYQNSRQSFKTMIFGSFQWFKPQSRTNPLWCR